MSEDKLKTVKNYKFTTEIIQLFENALKKIHDDPIQTEVDPTGTARVSQSSQMERLIEIGLLSLEMNLAYMKHSLAMHIEHDLADELKAEQIASMEDMMKGAMKGMGFDKDKYRE
jgi:hypothetical protein